MQRNRSAHTTCLIVNYTVWNDKHADFQLTKKCQLVERTLIKLQQYGNWNWEYKVAHSQKSFKLISCALKKKQALSDFTTFTRTVRVCAMFLKKKTTHACIFIPNCTVGYKLITYLWSSPRGGKANLSHQIACHLAENVRDVWASVCSLIVIHSSPVY